LEKDLRRRLHDIADARIEIEDASVHMTPAERNEVIEIMDALRREMGGEYFRRPRSGQPGAELSLTEFSVLMLLSRDGERTIGELAADLGCSHSATSRLANRMVRRGALVRREGSDDRRARRVALSPSGRALLGSYHRSHSQTHVRMLKLLTPDERALVLRALRLIREAVGRSRALRREGPAEGRRDLKSRRGSAP
jgi:DNA-binding MarR family transcriptional regulator